MALIIRAAAIAPVSRQLRRPGALLPAAPAAADAAPAEVAAPIAADAVPVHPERAVLMEQAVRLAQEQQTLSAAREQVEHEKQQLGRQREELQAAQQALQADAERIKADAERLGYAHGLERAGSEAAETTAAQLGRLNAVVQAIAQAKRALLDEHEDLLAELAFTAVCRVLGSAAASRAGLESMVGALVAAEREPDTLRVRMHPQDLPLLADDATPALDPRLQFVADAGVDLGGCLIDGPRGTLDARLELQVQQLRSTLLQVRQQRGQQEVPL